MREGDFATAESCLSQALASFEARAKRKRFIFEPSLLLAQGYLALIHAELGNRKAAQEFFARSEKYLRIIHMDELIASYHSRMNLS